MRWCLSHRADPVARRIADRHYNRQKIGTPQFVPPGRCLVLVSDCANAFWITSWPFAEYVKHATKIHGEQTWGWTWKQAGFREVGETKGGLLALQLLPADMPEPEPARAMSVQGFGLFNVARPLDETTPVVVNPGDIGRGCD